MTIVEKCSHFDLLNTPLSGTNLIEASAGTGKTYTITGLYLRLLLEKEWPVDKLLVVTFTEAATQELKGRIRERLRETVEVFSGSQYKDPFLQDLFIKCEDRKKRSIELLTDAIRDFDQAAIFTIHGFCMRMLQENAFESGALFDTQLQANQEELQKEIVWDFWRKHFYLASPLFTQYVVSKKITPDTFVSFIGKSTSRKDLKIIPDYKISDFSDCEKQFKEAFTHVNKSWAAAHDEVSRLLLFEGFNRTKYPEKKIGEWLSAMDEFLKGGDKQPMLFKGFEKFTASTIANSVKKGFDAPVHTFFDACEHLKNVQVQLVECYEQHLIGLKTELIAYALDELDTLKRKRNILTFDDLLNRLHEALIRPEGKYLIEKISSRFPAALIDEFQDTDPVQYAIFNTLFSKDNLLYLIGDPKQAIYGFRGADIFAYMDAARHVQHRYTLSKNWRSEPGLIKAVNTLFGNTDSAFIYKEIPFLPVEPAGLAEKACLKLNGEVQPALQLWYLDAKKMGGAEKPIAKKQAEAVLPKAVGAEISTLLNMAGRGRANLGDTPLKAGDMAVLVRTNREARIISEALLEKNIPAIIYSTQSIFTSFEAGEILLVLSGIVRPNSPVAVKTALSTEMMGICGEELERLAKDEDAYEIWLEKFREYHNLWRHYGFIRMFRLLLRQENILPRLMAFPDGERRCTNLFHLMELVQEKWIQKKTGLEELLKWFSQQMDNPDPAEHQIRLESDKDAVKIVTIHKSKGLEYPVVFCPFAFNGARMSKKSDQFVFHDPARDFQLTLDLGSETAANNLLLAEQELLAENLRLFYVALTRAKNRCYFVWGRFKGAETSAHSHLIHNSGLDITPEDTQGFLSGLEKNILQSKKDADLENDLTKLASLSDQQIKIVSIPFSSQPEFIQVPLHRKALSGRSFTGRIDRTSRIASFSSLVSKNPHGAELADYDAAGFELKTFSNDPGTLSISDPPMDIFSFPKGAKPGTFIHELFEHLDFTCSDALYTQRFVTEKLSSYGLDQSWTNTICTMLTDVLSVQLDENDVDFKLSSLTDSCRLNEMEFYFPLKRTAPEHLRAIFKKHFPLRPGSDFFRRIEQLEFSPVEGFMKGFVDLIFRRDDRFFIVDWKSNHLGNSIESYEPGNLADAMEDELYVLQYHIYTLALHRYLSSRMPGYCYEDNFGGVFYIFVRGVDPAMGSQCGIYKDRPSLEIIEALSEGLIDDRKMHETQYGNGT